MDYSSRERAARRLREERELRGWSQQHVADQIGADRYYLSRWENGKMLPSPYYREKLCALFGKNAQELGFLAPDAPPEPEQASPLSPATSFTTFHSFHDPFIPPLPAATHALVGRDLQLATLKERLCADTPSVVLALNGLPGVGKTALAVALAHDQEIRAHFSDGVLWAAAGKEPDMVGILSRWGALLHIPSVEAARLTTHQAWERAVRLAIGDRRILFIIDDAWTLEQIASFKVGGSACAYLVTTRFPQLAWYIAADGTFPVAELGSADSMILLERLAPQVVQQERKLAEELARLVGGLPLALLLTGNFLRVQASQGHARRMRQAIERLRTVEMRLHLEEPRSFTERSPGLEQSPAISLHTLIAVSDRQLEPEARQALYALSVFPAKPNTFSEEAALAVCQKSSDVLDALSDAGLLESYPPDRYALHQTIVDYASLHLTDTVPAECFTRYIEAYVQRHEKAHQLLELESENIRAALRLASEQNLSSMMIATGEKFARFLLLYGSYTEAEDIWESVRVAAMSIQERHGLATALFHLGEISAFRGEYPQAQTRLHEALACAQTLQDSSLMSQILRLLGSAEGSLGNYPQAEEHLQEALTFARQKGDPELISFALRSLGATAGDQGKFTQSEKYQQEGLAIARQTDNSYLICSLLINLTQLKLIHGQFSVAEPLIQEALKMAMALNYRPAICLLYEHQGIVALEQGKYAEAGEPLERCIEMARQIELHEYLIGSLGNKGLLFLRQGQYEQAEPFLREGLNRARALGHWWLIAAMLDVWSEFYLSQGRFDEVIPILEELYKFGKQGSPEYEAMALYGQSQVALAHGDLAEARRLGERSLSMLRDLDHYKAPDVEKWITTHLT